MKSTEMVSKYRLLVIAFAAYLATFAFDLVQGTQLTLAALIETSGYFKEMLQVMPAVFIATALISTWVPRELIANHLGPSSGLRGRLASLVIGSVSAGPIYAAFPIARTLMQKGASIGNVVIIISSWAVIKVPMLAVEARFLGPKFTLVRYLWTVPSIVLMGFISSRMLTRADLPPKAVNQAEDSLGDLILRELPGYQCKACGFEDCAACADAIASGRATSSACVPGGVMVETRIATLLATNRPSSPEV